MLAQETIRDILFQKSQRNDITWAIAFRKTILLKGNVNYRPNSKQPQHIRQLYRRNQKINGKLEMRDNEQKTKTNTIMSQSLPVKIKMAVDLLRKYTSSFT